MTVKQRVLEMLVAAYISHEAGMSYFYFQGPGGRAFGIPLHGGYIAQSYFCDPKITGSTCGKRRLRDLRQEMSDKYEFQIKWFHGGMVGYRIKPRQATVQSELQMMAEI